MAFKRHLTRMTGLVIVTAFLISTTPVAATENLLQSYQGGYIESELDSNTPVYDSGISTFAELPLTFPDDASVFDTMYPQTRDQNPYTPLLRRPTSCIGPRSWALRASCFLWMPRCANAWMRRGASFLAKKTTARQLCSRPQGRAAESCAPPWRAKCWHSSTRSREGRYRIAPRPCRARTGIQPAGQGHADIRAADWQDVPLWALPVAAPTAAAQCQTGAKYRDAAWSY